MLSVRASVHDISCYRDWDVKFCAKNPSKSLNMTLEGIRGLNNNSFNY